MERPAGQGLIFITMVPQFCSGITPFKSRGHQHEHSMIQSQSFQANIQPFTYASICLIQHTVQRKITPCAILGLAGLD